MTVYKNKDGVIVFDGENETTLILTGGNQIDSDIKVLFTNFNIQTSTVTSCEYHDVKNLRKINEN